MNCEARDPIWTAVYAAVFLAVTLFAVFVFRAAT